MIDELLPQAERIAARLKARGETISIAESSTAGLISAALLAIAGASAYFMGGAVVYTRQSRDRTARSHRAGTDRDHPVDRGLRAALRPQDPRQARHDVVGRRDRDRRADRQPLWPRRRSFLHRRHRPQWRALDHGRDRQQRPGRQHARLLRRRSRPVGEKPGLTSERTRVPFCLTRRPPAGVGGRSRCGRCGRSGFSALRTPGRRARRSGGPCARNWR